MEGKCKGAKSDRAGLAPFDEDRSIGILLGQDGLDGALLHTGAAIGAEIGVNGICGLAFADGLHGADINAAPTGNTGIGYLVSHLSSSLNNFGEMFSPCAKQIEYLFTPGTALRQAGT